MTVKTPLYLDYQATTPLDPRVLEVMMPYLTEKFGNPHSASHRFGWEADAGVDVARAQVAALIGAAPDEIVFTSGATEANNLAIQGTAFAYARDKRHVITVATEHKCVMQSVLALEQFGFVTTFLPVGSDGVLDLDQLRDAIRDDTSLVSVMAVNNEIGVTQPLYAIGQILRERGVKFHVDAAQAAGKIPMMVDDIGCDLMSISAHKLYGPKGVGALYVRKSPKAALLPMMHGGGQERGLRSGTLAPALVAGFGAAVKITQASMAEETPRIEALGRRLLQQLQNSLSGVTLNGSADQRYYGNLNISFAGVDGDLLIADLRDLAISSGAACASGSNEPSYVLQAIAVPRGLIKSSLRIGVGRFTTEDDIDYAAQKIISAVLKLRETVS